MDFEYGGAEAGRMQRPLARMVLLAVLVSLAGCQVAGPGGGPGTGVEYVVTAHPTDVGAGNASVVNASTPRLSDAAEVRDALAEAAADGGAVVHVDEERYAELERTLASVPDGTTPTEDDAVAAVLYVEYEGAVYRVTVRKRFLV